jgi:hypothetical protein
VLKKLTDTSRWTLVIHRVTATSAEFWVGTLFPSMRMPERARIRVVDHDGKVRTLAITRQDWVRPFQNVSQRFFVVKKLSGLRPKARYQVLFDRRVDEGAETGWQELKNGTFETLPERLPRRGDRPFTVAIASCFYDHGDGGSAALAYKNLYDQGPEGSRTHVTFLTGDQVYLDIGFDALSPIPRELRERIADDYAKHWQSLGSILTRGGTWMLPDDHEYWNDYPYYDSVVPTLWMLKVPKVRAAWSQAAKDGVTRVQRSPVVEHFAFGDDLSFCVADLRSYRGVHGGQPVMMHPDVFPRLLSWARGLQGPGVLVSSQPLFVERERFERNLLSFGGQYAELLSALGQSGHDVVLLSGDVHFGRIASCPLGPKGGRLIEIIASPLSNLTGLSGVATATPKFKPKHFPPLPIAIDGWRRETITYDRDFAVQTVRGSLRSPYLRTRTKEHFMTVGFCRTDGGRVELSAQGWHVREPTGPRGLPAKAFTRPYRTTLA